MTIRRLKVGGFLSYASNAEIAYIGDDLNDLECIEFAGCSACPADAVVEIKSKVNYVCQNKGGEGALREMIERFHHD